MPKALAIDYGEKRTGIAITDSLMMIASPLETVQTKELKEYLHKLLSREQITFIVLGEARHADGSASAITTVQAKFAEDLTRWFPHVAVERIDERYTSKLAMEALVAGGMKKKDRQKKENLDKVSAAIILQWWLERRQSSRPEETAH